MIPAFEGLLPEPHNTCILNLLFAMAEWHAAAKLHMHTDSSLEILSSVTAYLGSQLRHFARDTCSQFDTRDLPREGIGGRRSRRKQHKTGLHSNTTSTNQGTSSAKHTFSMATYKLHSLGDYVEQIKWFGTTDSYTTQPVCGWSTLCTLSQKFMLFTGRIRTSLSKEVLLTDEQTTFNSTDCPA